MFVFDLCIFQDDEDQCEAGNHDCEDTCVNTVGSFRCSCSKKGYKLADDGKTCQGSNNGLYKLLLYWSISFDNGFYFILVSIYKKRVLAHQ